MQNAPDTKTMPVAVEPATPFEMDKALADVREAVFALRFAALNLPCPTGGEREDYKARLADVHQQLRELGTNLFC